jgi:2-methylcitrate dehydratase PrpD
LILGAARDAGPELFFPNLIGAFSGARLAEVVEAHTDDVEMIDGLWCLKGYDVAGRLAGGFTPRPLAHQNGQVSLLAAAAAGARLRGLGAAGISRAMRIATTLLLTPSYTNAVAGATALNVAGGMSGRRC